MEWAYLMIAIVSEVVGSTALKAAGGFRNPWPSLIVVLGFGSAFYFLSLTLNAIPLGVAYAVWSGVGIALVSLAGWVFYRQTLGPGEAIGVGLIVLGVIVLYAFGKRAG
jgi:small multidrug resistance pump